jgi:hypothetical protein
MFYTYAHYTPAGKLFYIGKGQRKRCESAAGRNNSWKEIVSKEGGFKTEILSRFDSEIDCFEHEIFLIDCFRSMGFELCNKAHGGQGSSGWTHTKEWKVSASSKRAGELNYFHGKSHSDASKEKIKNSKLGCVGPWRDKPRSEETKRKISESLKGRPGRKHTDEARAKLSAAHTGKKQKPPTDETRKKLSESIKISWIKRKQSQKGN